MSPSPNPPPKPKRRNRLLLAFAAFLALLAAILSLTIDFHPEPTYQGKPASYWLDYEDPYFTGSVISLPDARETAFKAMGRDAVPLLIKALGRKPSSFSRRTFEFARGHDFPAWFVNRLPDPDVVELRPYRACLLLDALGPQAVAAIPALARFMRSSDQFWGQYASSALSQMGESNLVVLPELVENLASTNEWLQTHSAVLLGTIGPKAAAAIPALRHAASGTNQLAIDSARSILRINHDTNLFLQVCSNLLARSQGYVPVQALQSLNAIGPAARPLTPAIEATMRHGGAGVRWQAEEALRTINPEWLKSISLDLNRDIPALVTNLITQIRTGDSEHVARALHAVEIIGPQAAAAVPALMEVLDRPLQSPALIAAWYGSLQSERLLAQCDDPLRFLFQIRPGEFLQFTGQLPAMAAHALGEIGPPARPAVPQLLVLLRTQPEGASAYCRALGGIGPGAPEAVPALEDLLNMAESLEARFAAAEALSRIAPEKASNALQFLRGYWPVSSSRGTVALWRLREHDDPVPDLLAQFEKLHDPLLLRLLGDIGPEAKPALPVLAKTLETKIDGECGAYLRQSAAIAIRKIDPTEAARLNLPGTLALP